MSDDTAISVEHVSKNFVLPHEKVTTIKGLFTSAFRRRTKTKEVQHALRDVSFEVKKGEFFGIVGRNGSGKSTMLKMLAGIYQPTKGKLTVKGKLVPFIELGVGFNPELTGRENVYLNGAMMGFSKAETDAMYDDIVTFADLKEFMDQKLKNYSSGMQVRLAFSVAIKAEADILLIDEVLAVGDADFQRKCYEYFKLLKKNKKTVVFISHDMSTVREYCDRAILIDDSKVKAQGSANEIANKYSQQFIEQIDEAAEEEKDEVIIEGERWGTGALKITAVDASVTSEEVTVTVTAKVKKRLERVIYGLHVLGQDGVEVTAMNNRMIMMPDVENLEPGTSIRFEWSILNIFNDGKYSITLTLIDESHTPLDWFVNAAQFRVRKPERSTTAVLPPVKVTHSVVKETI